MQCFVLAVVLACVLLDNDWRVALAGGLALPLVAELPRRRRPDTRKRPDGWNQADEIVLRARERWEVLLRQGFWATWAVALVVADRAAAGREAADAWTTRGIALAAVLAGFVALAVLTRRQVSARIVRGVEAAVRAEGRYPPG